MRYSVNFPNGTTEYYVASNFTQLLQLAPAAYSIIITDKNVQQHFGHLFTDYKVIIIEPGEDSKTIETISKISEKLTKFEAHKNTLLIGIGGGVISDITGFVGSIYMRGIVFGFVPTTILGMVDAAIGGKNGVNVGLHKNMLGNIKQPKFILYDNSFLETLPKKEWSNGFAEVIKYGLIGNAKILENISSQVLHNFKNNTEILQATIALCVQEKNKIVLADEQEKNLRKTLNFGHTAGHAFETIYDLKHGQAVALGMIVALIASEQNMNLPKTVRTKLIHLLNKFDLPVSLQFDVDKVMSILKLDKKRNGETIDFILLKNIGEAAIVPLNFEAIRLALQAFANECTTEL